MQVWKDLSKEEMDWGNETLGTEPNKFRGYYKSHWKLTICKASLYVIYPLRVEIAPP